MKRSQPVIFVPGIILHNQLSICQLFQQIHAEHRGRMIFWDAGPISLGDSLRHELNKKLQFSSVELKGDHAG